MQGLGLAHSIHVGGSNAFFLYGSNTALFTQKSHEEHSRRWKRTAVCCPCRDGTVDIPVSPPSAYLCLSAFYAHSLISHVLMDDGWAPSLLPEIRFHLSYNCHGKTVTPEQLILLGLVDSKREGRFVSEVDCLISPSLTYIPDQDHWKAHKTYKFTRLPQDGKS